MAYIVLMINFGCGVAHFSVNSFIIIGLFKQKTCTFYYWLRFILQNRTKLQKHGEAKVFIEIFRLFGCAKFLCEITPNLKGLADEQKQNIMFQHFSWT